MTNAVRRNTLLRMPSLDTVTAALRSIAPLELAAEWDSMGLIAGRGDADRPIERAMTCLTLSPDVAREAVGERVGLVVTHHPLPFRPVGRITDESLPGRVLLDLLSAGIAVYSPHTAWDSAAGGINDQLADLCGLRAVRPIQPHAELHLAGTGRMGHAEEFRTVRELAISLFGGLGIDDGCHVVGDPGKPAGLVGIVCGSGGDLLTEVRTAGCDTLITGEVRFHTAVEARAAGLAVIALGHYASERFACASLARRLAEAVPGLEVLASRVEADPFVWIDRER